MARKTKALSLLSEETIEVLLVIGKKGYRKELKVSWVGGWISGGGSPGAQNCMLHYPQAHPKKQGHKPGSRVTPSFGTVKF